MKNALADCNANVLEVLWLDPRYMKLTKWWLIFFCQKILQPLQHSFRRPPENDLNKLKRRSSAEFLDWYHLCKESEIRSAIWHVTIEISKTIRASPPFHYFSANSSSCSLVLCSRAGWPRLGEFSPNGWMFTLDSFIKITEVSQIIKLLNSMVKLKF
jgi:hypothetical protein